MVEIFLNIICTSEENGGCQRFEKIQIADCAQVRYNSGSSRIYLFIILQKVKQQKTEW
jgi:hypothetical protein